jgi:hypothetical protein
VRKIFSLISTRSLQHFPCAPHLQLSTQHFPLGTFYFLLFAQFTAQPRLRQAPVAAHGAGRDFQHFGSFFDTQAAEKFQLHHLHFARIKRGECRQRVIERDQFGVMFIRLVAMFELKELDNNSRDLRKLPE